MGSTDRTPSAAPGIGFGGLPSSSCRHHHKCEGSHSGVRSAHFRDIAVVGGLPSSACRCVVVTCMGPAHRIPSAAIVIVLGGLLPSSSWRHHHKCEGSHSGVRSAHFRDIAVVGSLPSSAWRRVVVTCTGPTDRVPSAALVTVFGDLPSLSCRLRVNWGSTVVVASSAPGTATFAVAASNPVVDDGTSAAGGVERGRGHLGAEPRRWSPLLGAASNPVVVATEASASGGRRRGTTLTRAPRRRPQALEPSIGGGVEPSRRATEASVSGGRRRGTTLTRAPRRRPQALESSIGGGADFHVFTIPLVGVNS